MKSFKHFLRERTAAIGELDQAAFAKKIAEYYHFYKTDQNNHYIVVSYSLLRNHINFMYQKIVDDLKIKVVESSTDPYNSDIEMMTDIYQNKTLKVYTGHSDHPFFTPQENIRFRVVHDYFSHYVPNKAAFEGNQSFGSVLGVSLRGHDFTFMGELQAYRVHTRYAGDLEQINAALFSEIVGQVCYFHHFGAFPSPQKMVDFSKLLDINNISMGSFNEKL